jgi:hypothetical protein
MNEIRQNKYTPDLVPPPGDTLIETLEAKCDYQEYEDYYHEALQRDLERANPSPPPRWRRILDATVCWTVAAGFLWIFMYFLYRLLLR